MVNYQEIRNYLLENQWCISKIVLDVIRIDGSLGYLEYWGNDKHFFNTFFYQAPIEAVRASFYGDYRFYDSYVRFNIIGKLESFNDCDLEEQYKNHIEDIIEKLLQYHEQICLPTELKELIEK